MLFVNNNLNIELMNIIIIGPLLLYTGTKKTYSELVFSGGDDYELLFTAKKDKRNLINGFGHQSNTLLSRVGSIKHNEGVLILDRVGNEVLANSGGWQHF